MARLVDRLIGLLLVFANQEIMPSLWRETNAEHSSVPGPT